MAHSITKLQTQLSEDVYLDTLRKLFDNIPEIVKEYRD
jgi:hypothetical protein